MNSRNLRGRNAFFFESAYACFQPIRQFFGVREYTAAFTRYAIDRKCALFFPSLHGSQIASQERGNGFP